MKNLLFVAFIFSVFIVSCSKKAPADLYPADSAKASYDTIPVDSFSDGATSVDIVQQIRMSSQKYQDSVKEALKLQEQEKKLKEELEKENKKKTEDEKKKADEEKKQKVSETSSANGTKTE
jgi:hydroxylamine reductase (hybrid-cluster protein)